MLTELRKFVMNKINKKTKKTNRRQKKLMDFLGGILQE